MYSEDGRREPDSGIGYTQDHQTRWTDDGWVEPDSFAPNTVQRTGCNRRAGGRSAVKQIPYGTVLRRDNQWGIPRKRALFVSDGPDSTTSGSDILEGHYAQGGGGVTQYIIRTGTCHKNGYVFTPSGIWMGSKKCVLVFV